MIKKDLKRFERGKVIQNEIELIKYNVKQTKHACSLKIGCNVDGWENVYVQNKMMLKTAVQMYKNESASRIKALEIEFEEL